MFISSTEKLRHGPHHALGHHRTWEPNPIQTTAAGLKYPSQPMHLHPDIFRFQHMGYFLVCTELELKGANSFELQGILSPSLRVAATCWTSDTATSPPAAGRGHQDHLHLCKSPDTRSRAHGGTGNRPECRAGVGDGFLLRLTSKESLEN